MSRRASAGDQSILKYKLVFKYGAPGETGWIALQVVELATSIGVAARRNSHRPRHRLKRGPSRPANSGMRCTTLMLAQGSPVVRAPAPAAAAAALLRRRHRRPPPLAAARPQRLAPCRAASPASSEDEPLPEQPLAGNSPILEVEQQSERALAYGAAAALLGAAGLALAVAPYRAVEFVWAACPSAVVASLARITGSLLLLAAVCANCLKVGLGSACASCGSRCVH